MTQCQPVACRSSALIGTHSDCQLVLKDAAVSRRHLLIRHLGDRLEAEDQQSKNESEVEPLGPQPQPRGANHQPPRAPVAVAPGGGVK